MFNKPCHQGRSCAAPRAFVSAPPPPPPPWRSPPPPRSPGRTRGQGLTLVHFSAQPELFLTQNIPCTPPNTPSHLLYTPYTTPKRTPIPQKALTLTRKVDECEPLPGVAVARGAGSHGPGPGRHGDEHVIGCQTWLSEKYVIGCH